MSYSASCSTDVFNYPGELLASAGDDGNVILWVPSDAHQATFGSDGLEDKETWRARHMCRSSGAEIYDLAWSPDGSHFIIGSMDNIARIYNATSGMYLCQFCFRDIPTVSRLAPKLNRYAD